MIFCGCLPQPRPLYLSVFSPTTPAEHIQNVFDEDEDKAVQRLQVLNRGSSYNKLKGREGGKVKEEKAMEDE